MIQTHCPDADRLRALITDPDLPDYADLETHLAHCGRCQARLDEIAVGESGWLKDAGRLAASTDPDPEMTKTLHRLRDYGPDDAHGPPISLDFLTPSSQPGLLGTLGRYQVLDVIGRGAMGIVLKAIDPDLLRPVAIKVLAPYLASSGTARQRFLREARAAAAVSHDHIVTIHAVEPGELPYIVMEFISGISLQARLDRDGPLPPRDIARIGLQAANGLAAAHAVGLVHRDVKPANILLENGVERVKITDFGLARAADDARLTQSGTAAGTPLYMSPEQARGETVDQRSDLFSLGAVLYTLATGFPPFRAGSTMGVLNRIANDPPRPIRETVPDFPAALEAIIMQLLEKDPANRFQVTTDVSVKLTGYLNDPQAEPRRPRRRLPKWWETSLPILAGILVLGTVLYFKTRQGTLIVDVEDPNIKVALDGRELKIIGAGPQEIRLTPGDYHVTAMKDGKPVKAVPEVVRIERDGKQIVKVTAVADPPAPPEADTEKMKEELGRLMRELGQSGMLVPGKMRPDVARLSALLMEASNRDTPPDKARQALVEAYTIGRDLSIPPKKPDAGVAPTTGPAAAPKADPEWGPKLDALMKKYEELAGRLATTSAGTLMLTPGPIKDLDKAVASINGFQRDYLRQLLALRDQFLFAVPRAQVAASKLAELRGKAPAAQVEQAAAAVRAQYDALAKALSNMETLAIQLGAKPAAAEAIPSTKFDPDAKLQKLTSEYDGLIEQASKTPIGRVLTAADKERQSILAGLTGDRAKQAQRLLSLRDEFAKVTQEFRKAIGPWEQARLAARTARVRHEAGVMSSDELEKAELTLKDAERTLSAAEAAAEKILAELRPLVAALKAAHSWDADEAEFKKIMAEYDALNLRLVNTPVGRVLALEQADSVSEQALRDDGVPEAGLPTARKLLSFRFKIRGQRSEAERHIVRFHDFAANGQQAYPDDIQGLKFRNGALRGLVDDLKRVTDELDPPPTPEAEFKKLTDEYEALVLRLAKTTPGRFLGTTKPNEWDTALMNATLTPPDRTTADQLLKLRDQVTAQREKFEGDVGGRASSREWKAKLEAAKGDPKDIAIHVERIKESEADMKLRLETLRGLVRDFRKLADGIDSPKGK